MTNMFNILSNLIIESLLFCGEDVRHTALEWSIRLAQELVKVSEWRRRGRVVCLFFIRLFIYLDTNDRCSFKTMTLLLRCCVG